MVARNTKFDLEEDLTRSSKIIEKCKNRGYAQNLYASLCNMQWQYADVFNVLKDELWHCSWRYAGGIIANLRGEGDYMDWYCSGMGESGDYDIPPDEFMKLGYVPESVVTNEIRADLKELGWYPVPYNDL